MISVFMANALEQWIGFLPSHLILRKRQVGFKKWEAKRMGARVADPHEPGLRIENAPVLAQMPKQISPLHATTTPDGITSTAVLARRCK